MWCTGQKAERVGGQDGFEVVCPPMGSVSTVVNVYTASNGVLQLELAEWPAPETDEVYAGFVAKYFRPVVSTDTGMAVLENIRRDVTNKILRPIFEDEQV